MPNGPDITVLKRCISKRQHHRLDRTRKTVQIVRHRTFLPVPAGALDGTRLEYRPKRPQVNPLLHDVSRIWKLQLPLAGIRLPGHAAKLVGSFERSGKMQILPGLVEPPVSCRRQAQKTKSSGVTGAKAMVEPDGIEPTTSCLQSRRSPN